MASQQLTSPKFVNLTNLRPQFELLDQRFLPKKAHSEDGGYDVRARVEARLTAEQVEALLALDYDVYINGSDWVKRGSQINTEAISLLFSQPVAVSLPSRLATVPECLVEISSSRIPLGFRLALPPAYVREDGLALRVIMDMRPRSGWADKYKISLTNSPGLIDAGFPGEVCALLENRGTTIQVIQLGCRIAQVVFCEAIDYGDLTHDCVDALVHNQERSGGLGHTGTT